jgi:hypothetical protein
MTLSGSFSGYDDINTMRNFMTYLAHTLVFWCAALPHEEAVLASGGPALRTTSPGFQR